MKVIDQFTLSAGLVHVSRMKYRTTKSYRKMWNVSEGGDIELLVAGPVSVELARDASVDVEVCVFEDKTVIPKPKAKLLKETLVRVEDIQSYLIDKYGAPKADLVLAQAKIGFGYCKDKQGDAVRVSIVDNILKLEYPTRNSFDPTRLLPKYGKLRTKLNSNFGGTETMNTLSLLGTEVSYEELSSGTSLISLKLNKWDLKDTEFTLFLDNLEWLEHSESVGSRLGLAPYLGKGTREDDLNLLLLGFVVDMTSNLAVHAYRTFNKYAVREYEACSFPVLIPVGYSI